ncbi:hypothetical protein BASA81_002787 [Batrachochytrium salamandrivorans]|nr:hypothetical protein BASA81_002787 [Batrachochytrium salamandrivorans]
MLSFRRSSHNDPPEPVHDKSSEGSESSSTPTGLLGKLKGMVRSNDGQSPSPEEPNTPHSTCSHSVIAEKDFSKQGTTVRQILEHPSLGPKFRDFAKSFHADEGIQFLDQLATSRGDDFKAIAKELMERYFLDGAACWVNLPNTIHEELLTAYRDDTYSSVSQLFESAMYETFTDLKKSDTFRKFCFEDADAKAFSNDADIMLLEQLICPEYFRTALQAVEDQEPLLANLVRFCASVGEFERLVVNDKERKAKGQKISSTFVQSGAQFHINLPALYTLGVEGGNYDKVLPDAKIECLQTLSKCEALMMVARKNTVSRQSSVKPLPPVLAFATLKTPLQHFFAKDGALGRELIAACVGEKMDVTVVNKLKFLAATSAFMELPEHTTNKNATGRKIVSNFIQPGSNFEITGLGLGFVDDLTGPGNVDFAKVLPVVYNNVLSDVGSIPELVELASRLV